MNEQIARDLKLPSIREAVCFFVGMIATFSGAGLCLYLLHYMTFRASQPLPLWVFGGVVLTGFLMVVSHLCIRAFRAERETRVCPRCDIGLFEAGSNGVYANRHGCVRCQRVYVRLDGEWHVETEDGEIVPLVYPERVFRRDDEAVYRP